LVEAHLLEGRSVSELAAAYGGHRSWIYKLLAGHKAGGLCPTRCGRPTSRIGPSPDVAARSLQAYGARSKAGDQAPRRRSRHLPAGVLP